MPKKQETAEFKELVEKLTATAPKGTARPSLAKAAAGFAKAVDLFNAAGADDAKTIEKLRKRIADLESEKANLKRKLENSNANGRQSQHGKKKNKNAAGNQASQANNIAIGSTAAGVNASSSRSIPTAPIAMLGMTPTATQSIAPVTASTIPGAASASAPAPIMNGGKKRKTFHDLEYAGATPPSKVSKLDHGDAVAPQAPKTGSGVGGGSKQVPQPFARSKFIAALDMATKVESVEDEVL